MTLDPDAALEQIYSIPRGYRTPRKPYAWNSQRGDYEAFLDWFGILGTISTDDYSKVGREELLSYLQDWLSILWQAWYFNNRHTISRVVPASLKHIGVLLHQLWRTQRRPFAKTLIKTGGLDAREVKGRIDPISVYQRYGHLEKNGKGYKALCVWHDDSNPSLVVYPDGHCYCFVCNNGGDVFEFIQRVEQCTFPESVKIAAQIG
jgi:hypothetical protein